MPINFIFDCEIAPVLIKSDALVRKAAKVDINTTLFLVATPTAAPTAFYSEMKAYINRFGYYFWKVIVIVEFFTSGSVATILSSAPIFFNPVP